MIGVSCRLGGAIYAPPAHATFAVCRAKTNLIGSRGPHSMAPTVQNPRSSRRRAEDKFTCCDFSGNSQGAS